MIATMRRLHERGRDSRDGAMLGPECVLVRRTVSGFRCLAPGEAAAIQAPTLGPRCEPGWLFDQARRIADALAAGEIALAQIHGLRIPVNELDDATLQRLAQTAQFAKANFDPDQPRVPAGNPDGGQWTDADGAADVEDEDLDDDDEKWPDLDTEDDAPDSESSGASDRSPPPTGGGDDDPPQIPSEQPRTTRERNRIARRSAEWLARAIAKDLTERVRTFSEIVQTTAWLAGNVPAILSYFDDPKDLDELHDAAAHPRLGYDRHHIVERQRRSKDPLSNWTRFGERLDARENLVQIPYWKHVEISSWYSKRNDAFGGLTPRAYLRGKSWEEQYQVGTDTMQMFGVAK